MASPFTPSSSHGASSGLPSTWTDGGQGDVTAKSAADGVTPLTIEARAGQTIDVLDVEGTIATWSFQSDGTISSVALAALTQGLINLGFGAAFTHDVLVVFPNFGGFATVLRIDQDGYLGIANNAAPADGNLANGECMFWFDSTNGVGATKLMVKGRSADGTVKAASIVLA